MSKQRTYPILTTSIAVSLLITACSSSEPSKEERIDASLQERLEDYRAQEYAKCLESYQMKASAEVDSILRIMAKTRKIDTISPPSRFSRPQRPDLPFGEFREPQPMQVDTPGSPPK